MTYRVVGSDRFVLERVEVPVFPDKVSVSNGDYSNSYSTCPGLEVEHPPAQRRGMFRVPRWARDLFLAAPDVTSAVRVEVLREAVALSVASSDVAGTARSLTTAMLLARSLALFEQLEVVKELLLWRPVGLARTPPGELVPRHVT